MFAPPRWVERYLAIPFKDRGRDAKGCDCFGLVRLVFAERCNIELPLYGFIGCQAWDQIASAIDAEASDQSTWRKYLLTQARAFDVVVMEGKPRHVGIMVSALHVLHTEPAPGPCCVPLSHQSVVHRLHPQPHPIGYRHHSLW